MATNLTTLFQNIADAIRAKTGSSEKIVAENFPAAIAELSSGGVYLSGPLSASAKELVFPALVGKNVDSLAICAYTLNSLQTNCAISLTESSGTKWVSYYDGTKVVARGSWSWDKNTATATISQDIAATFQPDRYVAITY